MGKKIPIKSFPILLGRKSLESVWDTILKENVRVKSELNDVSISIFPKRSISRITKNRKFIKYNALTSATLGHYGKDDKKIIVAAAGVLDDGSLETPEDRLKEMTDPISPTTRDDYIDCAYTDPIISPGLMQRNNAFFEDGFTITLALKSTIDEETGDDLEGDALDAKLKEQKKIYGKFVSAIRNWSELPDVDLLARMKTSHVSSVVQGRHLTITTPPISILRDGQLPESLTPLSIEETGNPVIDTLRRKLVAIRIKGMGTRKIALPDESIYIVRKMWNLRKDSMFFGGSDFEAFIMASKSYKRLVNFDLGKAVVAGYLRKIIANISATGDPASQSAQITNILNGLIDDGTDVIGANAEVQLIPVDVKIDSAVVKIAKDFLEEVLIPAAGTTKGQLGRTENLNRDTATISEITNIKYVRAPDEELIATAFERQLLNPLLAHLSGTELGELPVKILIIRKEKPETQIKDEVMEDKLKQAENMTFNQGDDSTGLGVNSSSIGRKVNMENTAKNRKPKNPPVS